MLALAFAVASGIERYDTTLFSVHMVQHVLLMLVAAPLIALAAPITLVLRLSLARRRESAGSCPSSIRGSCSFLAHPVVAWIIFAAMMWGTHFSALFNASLEDPLVHDLEHALFLDRRSAVLVAGGRARSCAVSDDPSRSGSCTCSCR